jgi:hypothetical protein
VTADLHPAVGKLFHLRGPHHQCLGQLSSGRIGKPGNALQPCVQRLVLEMGNQRIDRGAAAGIVRQGDRGWRRQGECAEVVPAGRRPSARFR